MGSPQDTSAGGAQWVVKMPGQPDDSVDTATLQMWARSGVLRPDSLVVETSSGMSYTANQSPGVFSSKSYVTALLLSFFVGALGIDRFYLGYTGLGIGKLLTFGGLGVWALIDFILIAMRKVTDSSGNPLA
jgi:TM2 domain-containing membrane protein YozV